MLSGLAQLALPSGSETVGQSTRVLGQVITAIVLVPIYQVFPSDYCKPEV
jgi:hypothetical protein